MKILLNRNQSWTLISVGLMLSGCSTIGCAWVAWSDGFTGTHGDHLGPVDGMVSCALA